MSHKCCNVRVDQGLAQIRIKPGSEKIIYLSYLSKNCIDMEGTWPFIQWWAFGPNRQYFSLLLRFPSDGKLTAFALHLPVFAVISVQQWHRSLALYPGAWAFVLKLIGLQALKGHSFFLDHFERQALLDWKRIRFCLLPWHGLHIAGFSSCAISLRDCSSWCESDWPHWLRAIGDGGDLWGEKLWSVVQCPRLGWLTDYLAYV